ncbi:unannotated protein [freshwater metagenome]|uniref:Unannotated protein n=1 Tax=freshwater metagenome TaxID=449393 RepID=A0A6J6EUT6_9ZZZZ
MRRGVVLDRQRRAAIGVSFAQHRVHGRALDFVVLGLNVFFGRGLRIFGVVRNVVALGLQFFDRSLELRKRSRNVRKFDDVGFGTGDEFTEFAKIVANALIGGEGLGEGGEDATGHGNVSEFDLNTGNVGERIDHRQQRLSRQSGGFIGVGVNDRVTVGRHGLFRCRRTSVNGP